MKICVFGLWHLGSVTAACLADAGFDIVGLDPDDAVVNQLAKGVPPLFEPGLAERMEAGLAAGRLSFTSDVRQGIEGADLVWVTFDTPVDNDDRADVVSVKRAVTRIFPFLHDKTVVLLSSQLPVGSTREFEQQFADVAGGRRASFAVSPENLRLGKAIEAFRKPERIVVGTRDAHSRDVIAPVLAPFCDRILWMTVESAEMAKHAINSFLATTIVYANELATLCERVGADAYEVEAALRSEPRIGQKAPVRPGTAFAGGTLARDVQFMQQIAEREHLTVPLLSAILPSNNAHRHWLMRCLTEQLQPMAGKTVAVLGLAYKAGTDSLRRSIAIELCRWLVAQGATVQAFDPRVAALPPDLAVSVRLASDLDAALLRADAAVVATECDEFRALNAQKLVSRMRQPIVIDQNRYLAATLTDDPRVKYVALGKPL